MIALSQDKTGWTLTEAISVAYRLGMFVCPFMQETDDKVFSEVYRSYPGILLGEQPAGHALAKTTEEWLINPADGSICNLWGPEYHRFTHRVYLAWTNSPLL